jgi:ATP synthase protein I
MSDTRSQSSHRRGVLRGLDQSSVMGVELITATLTWAGIGWLIDRWLGTEPWFLAIGALLGNAAGIYLIWLRGRRMDAAEAAEAARDDAGDTSRGVAP